MGISLYEVDKDTAIKYSKNYEVVSASKEKYFSSNDWKKDIITVQKVEGQLRFIFTLNNGDFVEVEKS